MRQQRIRFRTGQRFTLVVNAALVLFERIVRIQHRPDGVEGMTHSWQHQQSCQCSMIEPQPGSDRQRLAAPLTLRRRKDNPFLDPDMSQQAFSETFVGWVVADTNPCGGLSQQVIEPGVFGLHEPVELSAACPNRSGFAIFHRH